MYRAAGFTLLGAPLRGKLMMNHQKRLQQQHEELTSTLVKERDMFQAIVENTHTHLAYLDPQFNFVWVNPAYALGSGHSEEELIGRNHFELFPDPENQTVFERVRETGHRVEFNAKPFEYVDQPQRGITYWDWTLVPTKDEAGQVQGLVFSLLEVTEHEQAEEALREALQGARQRETEISALLEGSRAVLRHRDFDAATQSIFDASKRATGATAGYVALLSSDETENEVLFLDTGGARCTVDPTLPMPIRGLREEVYRTGKTAYENDFAESEWMGFIPQGHVGVDNILFAPLVITGVTVGLLGLANKPGGFTENDARMASAFGELAALSLLNSRALELLQNSEERFRSITQTASEAIITVDSRGKITFWNEAATSIFGYTRNEVIGQPLTFIMPERLRAAHREGMERVVTTGESRILGKTVEMVGVRKDGLEFPLELSLSTWKIKDEIFFSGMIHDITQRKRVEEEIQSLARFPSENRSPVLRVSQDGTILYANQASAPLLAVWASQVGQEIPDLWRQLITDAFNSDKNRTVQVACEECLFSLNIVPVAEAGYVNLYGRDVTERVQAEKLLREQNRFIMNVFESLSHPFYVMDANDYTIKMANSATHRGEIAGLVTCHALTHRRSTPCGGRGQRCPLEEVKKSKAPVVLEHIHYDQESIRRVYEVHGYPILDDEGNVTQMIEYTLDITKRKQAEEALRERVKELDCLYGISALVERPGITLTEILQGTVDLIPPAWQYPEITAAHVTLHGIEFKTERFDETTDCLQAAEITVRGQRSGTVEVCYLEETPESDGGPFLKEERSLLNAIAERLGKVTERLQAEAALRESEEKWRSITEYSPDHILLLDKDANILFINHTLPGLVKEEVIGTSFYDYALQEYQQRTMECFDQVLQTGNPDRFESVYQYEDGTRGYFESHVGPVRSGDKVVGLTVSSRDITNRKRTEEALSTLLDISHHMTLTLELEPLLNLILDQLKAVVDYDNATVLGLEDGDLTALVHRGTIPPEEMRQLRLSPKNARFARRLVLDQETVIIPDIHGDTPLARDFSDAIGERFETVYGQTRSWMGVPLEIKDRVIGILALEHSEPDRFTLGQVGLALAFANQAAVVIENTRLYEQAQALAAIEERQRLARDLHDAVSQTLFSASLAADVLPRLWERKPEEGQRCLEELQLLTRSALAEMRTLLLELRPAALMEVELDELLRQLVEAAMSRVRVPVVLTVEGQCSLPPEVHVTLYRIAQEALSNIVKHAAASQAVVSLHCEPPVLALNESGREGTKKVELRIKDDGRGFDAKVVPADRLGLHIMHERAEAIGAAIGIESEVGQGTQLVVAWPGKS